MFTRPCCIFSGPCTTSQSHAPPPARPFAYPPPPPRPARDPWPCVTTSHISGGEHPSNCTVLGVTQCEASPAPAWEGCRGADAALVRRTVPLSPTDSTFPQWNGTSSINNFLLTTQTSANTRRYQRAHLLSPPPLVPQDAEGHKKDDGLSYLDIVKHAVKTVLHVMTDVDRLALVAFNHAATTAMALTHMDGPGQAAAVKAVESLRHGGQTNIWAGLLEAMEVLQKDSGDGPARQKTVLLLTDGQPVLVPPRGHVAELRDYKDSHPGFSFQLNTFGFGYELDSELLSDLAVEGSGTYAFIPDAIIVGTVFVNSVANTLATLSQSATLHLSPAKGAAFAGDVLGGHEVHEESWGRIVHIGPLQKGQSREVAVALTVPAGAAPYLTAHLSFGPPGEQVATQSVRLEAAERRASRDAVVAELRARTVTVGLEAVRQAVGGKGKAAQRMVAGLAQDIEAVERQAQAAGAEVDGRLTALKADVSGRMAKALNGRERFQRWGRHYLRALLRAHQIEVCTNYMDPGLQGYGGALFKALRDDGDRIFLTLPAPTPSQAKPLPACPRPAPGAAAAPAAPRPPSPQLDMQTYYAGAGGGCFGPAAAVELLDGSGITVDRVRAGAYLRVAGGGFARVRCVVRIRRPAHRALVRLAGGLVITPHHPVWVAGAWRRPADLPDATAAPNVGGCVYNFVLDHSHKLRVNGVTCATWGHGLEEEGVQHAYFGTRRILEDLCRLPGWGCGYVEVAGCLRDGQGQVVRLVADGLSTGAAEGGHPVPGAGMAIPCC